MNPRNNLTTSTGASTAADGMLAMLRSREVLDAADARLVGWLRARVTPCVGAHDDAADALTLVAATLCRACASGSLCLPIAPEHLAREPLIQALRETLRALESPHAPEPQTSDDSADPAGLWADRFLAASEEGRYARLLGTPASPQPLIRAGDNLYLHRYWFALRTIAEGLRAHAALPPPADEATMDPVLREILGDVPLRKGDGSPLTLTTAQTAALRLALSSSVFVLGGGPGTGKTTWTAAWLRAILRLPGVTAERVRICAPTGRAARRLEESLGITLAGCLDDSRDAAAAVLKVSTLHTLLGWRTFEGRFARSPDDPLDADWILLDEASMADVFLFASLVRALPPGARLVLAGDPGQLPAVEAGAVLDELLPEFDGAPSPLPAMILDVSHRATGDIIPLAAAIRRGDSGAVSNLLGAATDPRAAFATAHEGARNLALIDSSTEAFRDPAAAMRATLHAYAEAAFGPGNARSAGRGSAGYASLLNRFRTLTRAEEDLALDSLWDHAGRARVLAPLRRGTISSERANRILREHLEPSWRLDRDTPGMGFHGAPILVIRNDARTGLSNGDLGLWLETADGAMVFFPRPELPGGWLRLPIALLPPCEPGFASTVHKSQGSECDEVLILLPEAGNRLLARETLYTAVTRARTGVRIFGTEQAIREAVVKTLRRSGGLRGMMG